MNELIEKEHSYSMDLEESARILKESTIFDKIEYSNISKDRIRAKLEELDSKVSNRTVLLNMTDNEVKEYWFKNWLHPELKHWIEKSPEGEKFISQSVRERDAQINTLNFFENSQQNFNYSLEDIIKYIK